MSDVMYGPMWQWECGICRMTSDCFDTLVERSEDQESHVCRPTIMSLKAENAKLRDTMIDVADIFRDTDKWGGSETARLEIEEAIGKLDAALMERSGNE